MAFTEEIILKAWIRSEGQCECVELSHNHPNIRCCHKLVEENHRKKGEGFWEARRIENNDSFTLENCEILCWECFMDNIKPDVTL